LIAIRLSAAYLSSSVIKLSHPSFYFQVIFSMNIFQKEQQKPKKQPRNHPTALKSKKAGKKQPMSFFPPIIW